MVFLSTSSNYVYKAFPQEESRLFINTNHKITYLVQFIRYILNMKFNVKYFRK